MSTRIVCPGCESGFDAVEHDYFDCPSCGNLLRLPVTSDKPTDDLVIVTSIGALISALAFAGICFVLLTDKEEFSRTGMILVMLMFGGFGKVLLCMLYRFIRIAIRGIWIGPSRFAQALECRH